MECLARRRTRAQARRAEEYLGRAVSRALRATHDYNVANGSGAAVRSDINDVLSAAVTWNSGTSWATTFARMRVVDTSAGIVKRRNAANAAWITIATDDETIVLSRTSNTMLDSSDIGKTIIASTAFTQTFDAVATLGDGWYVDYKNNGAGTITLDPNASENINGATTLTLAPGESGRIWCNGSALFMQVAPDRLTVPMDRMEISGLTYSNNGSDATNDIDIAVGSARDSTNAKNLVLAAAITKRLDAGWAVGTNQGGLDTGSIANADYYIWLIMRSDTGVVDVLFSTSATAPTMPSNYDYKRLIGWFKRAGATIVAFKTYELEGGGLEFAWVTPRFDVSLSATLTTSRRTDALSVPLDFSVQANLVYAYFDAAGVSQGTICCPDETDAAPGFGSGAGNLMQGDAVYGAGGQAIVRTSATGTVASRSTVATVDSFYILTKGFFWARRNS